MVVCKFWQQGNCRFGENCRFEHPDRRDVFSNSNRFAALQSPDNSNQRNNRSQPRQGAPAGEYPYSLDKQAIIIDLSSERPQWILSAYGPGRHAPAQLFGGSLREQSPEEIRLKHYLGLAAGNPQQAVQEYESILQASEQQMQTALHDVGGAINFIIRAENEHPNRIDVCIESKGNSGGVSIPSTTTKQPAPRANAFGAPSQPAGNPFGAANQTPTTSTFGKPSGVGSFGQPSTLGQNPNPFGAPSAPSAFGTPSLPGNAGGAFGRPSVLGQKPNPFGVPSGQPEQTGPTGFSSFANKGNTFVNSTAAPSTAFGAPSQPTFGALSQSGVAPNPFGAPSQRSTNPNPFGAPSELSANPNPFGAPSQPPANPNPFGTPLLTTSTPFGAPSQPQANPFGHPSVQRPNPFGQPAVQTSNPFGAPSAAPTANPLSPAPKQAPFGAPSPAPANPFGAPSIEKPASTPFGAPTHPNPFGGTSAAPSNPFGNPQPLSTPSTLNPLSRISDPQQPHINGDLNLNGIDTTHPLLSSYASNDASGRLLAFKNQRVTFRNGEPFTQKRDGTWEKIWFPDGPPVMNKDTELKDEKLYDDEELKHAYLFARETGLFKDGVMPLVPPRREWCLWDF